ncbi:MAG: RNA polymerase sigma factor [Acidobacteria bacterium]|nr:MAG: RNA polymerase sigma factor [Acidobacteriota bacterium]
MRPKERMKAIVADEVVGRARSGDQNAFRTLVEAYSRDVFRLAFRITRNEQDAEDTVQETFIRAYQKLDGFEARANFGTWLYRITANSAIDQLRRKKRHEDRSVPLDEVTAGGVGPGQERAVFGRQVRERVESALVSLSELERAAFVLRHFEELSLAEIGATLDITVSATKQAIFRAVRKLRVTLAKIPRTAP